MRLIYTTDRIQDSILHKDALMGMQPYALSSWVNYLTVLREILQFEDKGKILFCRSSSATMRFNSILFCLFLFLYQFCGDPRGLDPRGGARSYRQGPMLSSKIWSLGHSVMSEDGWSHLITTFFPSPKPSSLFSIRVSHPSRFRAKSRTLTLSLLSETAEKYDIYFIHILEINYGSFLLNTFSYMSCFLPSF